MTKSMTKPGRATRAGAFPAMLAIVGMIGVMASVKTARAFDRQDSPDAVENEMNRQAAAQGYAVAPRPGPYASAHRDRRVEIPPATRKDPQDVK